MLSTTTTTRTLLLTATMTAALVGCEQSEPLTEEEATEVAQAAAPLAREDGGETATAQLAVDTAVGDSWLVVDASGSWTGLLSAVDYVFDIDCFDGNGDEVECSDETVRAEVMTDIEASLDLPRYDAYFLRDADWTLDALDTETPSVQGSAYTEIDSSFTAIYRDVERSWHLELNGDYDLEATGVPDRFTGTITWDAFAERTRDTDDESLRSTLDTEIELTYDGDGSPTMLVDRTYTFDVDASGEVTLVE